MPCHISSRRAIPQIGRSHLPNQGHSRTRAHTDTDRRHMRKNPFASRAAARRRWGLSRRAICLLIKLMERGVAAPVRLVVVQPPRWKRSSEGGLDSIFRSCLLRDLQLCGGPPSLSPRTQSIRMELISAFYVHAGTLCSVTPCFGEDSRPQSGSLRRR